MARYELNDKNILNRPAPKGHRLNGKPPKLIEGSNEWNVLGQRLKADQVKKAIIAHKTLYEAAEHLGVVPDTLRSHMKRKGIKRITAKERILTQKRI